MRSVEAWRMVPLRLLSEVSMSVIPGYEKKTKILTSLKINLLVLIYSNSCTSEFRQLRQAQCFNGGQRKLAKRDINIWPPSHQHRASRLKAAHTNHLKACKQRYASKIANS